MIEIAAIIQARMGSTRLPGKVLLDLAGKTVLERVVQRVSSARQVDVTAVATTSHTNDDGIETLCSRIHIPVYRGSEEDVLDRYYQTALTLHPRHIVRITADCPLVDPDIIDEVITVHREKNADYTSNVITKRYPDGLDVEVFTFSALQKAWKEAQLPSEREHVTPFIWKNNDRFTLASHECDKDLSDKRWTLDHPEDYEFIQSVFRGCLENNNLFGMEDILDFLQKNPEIEIINSHYSRNEGYNQSLQND